MADGIPTEWTGHDLLDVNGEKIGTVEDVRFGDATGGLEWLLVKTGLFGAKKVLVPAGEVKATKDALVVPFSKDRVKDAPGIGESEMFTPEQEQHICAYYGLKYTAEFGSPKEGCVDDEDLDAPAGSPAGAATPQAAEQEIMTTYATSSAPPAPPGPPEPPA